MTVQMFLLFGGKVHKDNTARIKSTLGVAQEIRTAVAHVSLSDRCSSTNTQTATSVVSNCEGVVSFAGLKILENIQTGGKL